LARQGNVMGALEPNRGPAQTTPLALSSVCLSRLCSSGQDWGHQRLTVRFYRQLLAQAIV
jgi:hypothetical protein